MGWRTIVISSRAKLDYQMGCLVIRSSELHKVYLNEVETLLIESTSVSLTTYLLSELVKRKIKVIFCDEKKNPSSELLPYYGSHDTSAKVREQIKWSQDTKNAVWTTIVISKIHNQMKLLEFLEKSEANLLAKYLGEIEFGDSSNREGHAAKVYFNALFGKGFSRNQDCPVNAALNYGYSLLLSSFNREIVSNGYITQLGIFHDNVFNSFNLACDLMESFRPIVDYQVIHLEPDTFGTEEKHEMLKIFTYKLKIGGRMESFDQVVKIYCRSILTALSDNDVSSIKDFQYGT